MPRKYKQPLFRFMLMRRILPSLLLLSALLVFFCILMSMTDRHSSLLRWEHQYERLSQSVMEIESSLTETQYHQREILNSIEYAQFVYMYDDLDWYRRYELQQSLGKSLLALRDSSDYVASAWLYIPAMHKAISDTRINATAPQWLTAYTPGSKTLQTIDGQLVYFIDHTDSEGNAQFNSVLAVLLDEAKILERLMYVQRSSLDEIHLEWNAPLNRNDPRATQSRKAAETYTSMTVRGVHFPFSVTYTLSEDETDAYVFQIILYCFIYVALVLFIEIFGYFSWYRGVYIPLHTLLIDAFGHAAQGDFKFRISIEEGSPFYPVYDSYNQMMAKTEAYVENELKHQLLVSRANLKQLQAQISPHFMYNSYYVLYRLIRKGDMSSSLILAEHLGQFYHYITRNADDEKHLDEEVEHARHYAAIQEFRFRDALDVQIEPPDPQIARTYVPRLILQPLLENAFKHAYETEDGGAVMQLRVDYEVRSPISFDIIVENSGRVSDETLESIRSKLLCSDNTIETTALVNIHRRLQIYFGNSSALQVDRSPLGGLLVRMRIEDIREDV